MLTYWIPDEPSLLPANASHQVGVGGFVINDQMEVSLTCTVLIVLTGNGLPCKCRVSDGVCPNNSLGRS